MKVVGVKFREAGKTYFFDPNDITFEKGEKVIVETAMGKEFGIVEENNREIDDAKLKEPLKKVIKKASADDEKHNNKNRKEEAKALDICKKKIEEHKLEMNLVEARYLFDNSKLIFFFTAENRIDFRELVKDLASIFKTRIELRQISTRDEVKRLGGCGICGRELCCCSFLKDFDGVSIKMAKEQNLSLNISKITGACGRLMCCLKYEECVYRDKMKNLPHPGAIVKTEDGEGVVDNVEVLKENVRVKFKDEENNNYYKKYAVKDIKIIKDSKASINKNNDEDEEVKELKKLEELDKKEQKNASKDDEA